MKIGLVPLHGWMPLAYTAAPIPAAAVLSGAAVKAGVIGLIRFLPFDVALPGWGEALVVLRAFLRLLWRCDRHHAAQSEDGAGLFQHQPDGRDRRRAGHGPCRRGQGAALDAAFYAAHHVLVKGALFLAVGVVAATSRAPPVAGAAAGGRPGAQPRRTAPDRRRAGEARGKGAAGRWRRRHARDDLGGRNDAAHAAFPAAPCADCFARRRRRRLRPDSPCLGWRWRWLPSWSPGCSIPSWAAMWPIHSTREALLEALWPVLIGAALAPGLWLWGNRLPRVPEGDIVVAEEAAFRASYAFGAALERVDARLRQWPARALSLLAVAIVPQPRACCPGIVSPIEPSPSPRPAVSISRSGIRQNDGFAHRSISQPINIAGRGADSQCGIVPRNKHVRRGPVVQYPTTNYTKKIRLCCAAPPAIASKLMAPSAKRAHDGQGDSGSCVLG